MIATHPRTKAYAARCAGVFIAALVGVAAVSDYTQGARLAIAVAAAVLWLGALQRSLLVCSVPFIWAASYVAVWAWLDGGPFHVTVLLGLALAIVGLIAVNE